MERRGLWRRRGPTGRQGGTQSTCNCVGRNNRGVLPITASALCVPAAGAAGFDDSNIPMNWVSGGRGCLLREPTLFVGPCLTEFMLTRIMSRLSSNSMERCRSNTFSGLGLR